MSESIKVEIPGMGVQTFESAEMAQKFIEQPEVQAIIGKSQAPQSQAGSLSDLQQPIFNLNPKATKNAKLRSLQVSGAANGRIGGLNQLTPLESFAPAVVNSILFGQLPRVEAGIGSLLGGNYQELLNKGNQGIQSAQQQNPSAFTTGNILGTLAPGGAVSKGAGLLGTMTNSAVGSARALLGATPTDQQNIRDTAIAGGVGGALGGVGYGIQKGAGFLGRKIIDRALKVAAPDRDVGSTEGLGNWVLQTFKEAKDLPQLDKMNYQMQEKLVAMKQQVLDTAKQGIQSGTITTAVNEVPLPKNLDAKMLIKYYRTFSEAGLKDEALVIQNVLAKSSEKFATPNGGITYVMRKNATIPVDSADSLVDILQTLSKFNKSGSPSDSLAAQAANNFRKGLRENLYSSLGDDLAPQYKAIDKQLQKSTILSGALKKIKGQQIPDPKGLFSNLNQEFHDVVIGGYPRGKAIQAAGNAVPTLLDAIGRGGSAVYGNMKANSNLVE